VLSFPSEELRVFTMSWELVFCGAVFSLFIRLLIYLCCFIGAIEKVMCVIRIVSFYVVFFFDIMELP